MKETYQKPIKEFEVSPEVTLEDLYVFGKVVKNAYGIGKMSLDRNSLAGNLGISIQTLESWESGNTVPKEENLEKVANVLGISLLSLKEIYTRYNQAVKLEREMNKNISEKPEVKKLDKDMDVFGGGGSNGYKKGSKPTR